MTTETQKLLAKIKRKEVKEGHGTLLRLQLVQFKLPMPTPEYQFHPTRKWSIDFAWPDLKLAVEVEGGIYVGKGTGHRSISGFEANLEKYNALAIDHWFLIRVLPEWLDLRNGKAIELINRFMRKSDTCLVVKPTG